MSKQVSCQISREPRWAAPIIQPETIGNNDQKTLAFFRWVTYTVIVVREITPRASSRGPRAGIEGRLGAL